MPPNLTNLIRIDSAFDEDFQHWDDFGLVWDEVHPQQNIIQVWQIVLNFLKSCTVETVGFGWANSFPKLNCVLFDANGSSSQDDGIEKVVELTFPSHVRRWILAEQLFVPLKAVRICLGLGGVCIDSKLPIKKQHLLPDVPHTKRQFTLNKGMYTLTYECQCKNCLSTIIKSH